MNNDMHISVIIASYNPQWKKMKATILSIIRQKGITTEVIIADDGSEDPLFDKISSFMQEQNYSTYKTVRNETNVGTVQNILSGVQIARGEYIKLISPGDMLFDENVLHEWYIFVKNRSLKVSFGDYVAYSSKELKPLHIISCPQRPDLYRGEVPFRKQWKNYLILNDAILGACFLTERLETINYLNEIIPHCKYAEDMIYRIMVSRKEPIEYFSRRVIWYEYGEGISTNGSEKWKTIIQNELNSCQVLIKNKNMFNRFDRLRFRLFTVANCKPLKYMIFPDVILSSINKNSHQRYTEQADDKSLKFFGEMINAGN